MRSTRICTFLLIAGALLSTARAQSVAPPPPGSTTAVTKEDIGYHVRWLSSEALEGRGTGTRGNAVAAEYLAREFKRYGLKPAGDNGSYLQTFEVVTGVDLGRSNRFLLTETGTTKTLAVQKDYVPFSFSHSGEAKGGIVFAGYGITSAKLKYNDYENIDVKDKLALVVSGHPDGDSPHSDFDNVASIRSKALFAREAGASALLVVNLEKDELYKLKYDNSPSNAGIIVVNVGKEIVETLFKANSQDLKNILEKIQKDKRPMSFAMTDVHAALTVSVSYVKKPSMNVIGKLDGTDPALTEQCFVVGAHFDHLGWGQDGSLYRGEKPMIHPGADDNASGTAGMLELAQYFAAQPLRRPMLFMGFTGEEMGLLGSSHWVNNPSTPLASIAAMFNLDMVGRLPDSTNKLNVQGTGTSPIWESIVKGANEPYNFTLAMLPDGQGASDQAAFYMKNIPVLFFFTGLHTDYHRPSDQFDKLNLPGEENVVRFTADIIRKTDEQADRPAFVKVVVKEDQKVRGFNVYVGTIPDYGSTEEGFKITGTSPGSPAEKAGLKPGDLIVQFGSTKLKNIYDYMNAMGKYKPEEDVPLVVKRGTETLTLTVHLVRK